MARVILGWGLDLWDKTQEEGLREMADCRIYMEKNKNPPTKGDWLHACVNYSQIKSIF